MDSIEATRTSSVARVERQGAGRHVERPQHRAGARGGVGGGVPRGQRGDEVGVGRAATGARAVRGQPAPLRAGGAAEAVRRDGRDQGDRGHPPGGVEQVLQDDARAHAPADEVHPGRAQGLHQRGDVLGPVPDAAAGVDGQRVGVAVPPQVDRERPHAAGPGQREQRLLPEQRRAHVAVHEQDDVPVGRSEVRELERLGVQDVLGQPRGAHTGGADPGQQRAGHGDSWSRRRAVQARGRCRRRPPPPRNCQGAHLPSESMSSPRPRRPRSGGRGPAGGGAARRAATRPRRSGAPRGPGPVAVAAAACRAPGSAGGAALVVLTVLVVVGIRAAGEPTPVTANGRCTVAGQRRGADRRAGGLARPRSPAVARVRGLPERAVVIALATAQQESALRNLDYGDRDSLGPVPAAPVAGLGLAGAGAGPGVRGRAVLRPARRGARLGDRPPHGGRAVRAALRLPGGLPEARVDGSGADDGAADRRAELHLAAAGGGWPAERADRGRRRPGRARARRAGRRGVRRRARSTAAAGWPGATWAVAHAERLPGRVGRLRRPDLDRRAAAGPTPGAGDGAVRLELVT